MIKRTILLIALAAIVSTALPTNVAAGREYVGRITDVTATSVSVRSSEIVTFTLDERTQYTKWITQKPWQEETRLQQGALKVGRLVALHARNEDGRVAEWIQIATDMR